MSGATTQHPGPGSLGPDEVHLWCVRLHDGLAKSPSAALRRVLGGYLGVPDTQVQLTRAPGGKPSLQGAPGVAFNLSHSGAVAAIAVSARDNLGVDIEQLRGGLREGPLRRALGPEEQALVRACPPGERERAFLRHWTAKEACLKALGIGLRADLKSLRIVDALECPVASGLGMDELDLQRWDPGAELIGSVAVSGGPWQARLLTLAPT